MAWPTTPLWACYGPTVYPLVAAWSRASICVLRSAFCASHRIAGGPHTLTTPWVHRWP
ncbi:hypothetical protein CFIO01_11959, partial [Colletotrichum fioriniae PJ7]